MNKTPKNPAAQTLGKISQEKTKAKLGDKAYRELQRSRSKKRWAKKHIPSPNEFSELSAQINDFLKNK